MASVDNLGLRITQADYDLVPARWRDGLRRLHATDCPPWLHGEWWRTYIVDAFRFMLTFGTEAMEAGWSISSLFGVCADLRLISLIADIRGDRVTSLLQDARGRNVASIIAPDGCRRWHYRQMPNGSPLLWMSNPYSLAEAHAHGEVSSAPNRWGKTVEKRP